MKMQALIEYFGSKAAMAKALGVERQAIQRWENNQRIPELRCYQIEVITKRKFKHDKIN